MHNRTKRIQQAAPRASGLRQSALPVALALLGAQAQAQTNPNDVAQAAIAAIAAMAAQSGNQAEVAQAAIAAIGQIAAQSANVEIARANATIAQANATIAQTRVGRVPAAGEVLDVEAREVAETATPVVPETPAAPVMLAANDTPDPATASTPPPVGAPASEPIAAEPPEPSAVEPMEPQAQPRPEPSSVAEPAPSASAVPAAAEEPAPAAEPAPAPAQESVPTPEPSASLPQPAPAPAVKPAAAKPPSSPARASAPAPQSASLPPSRPSLAPKAVPAPIAANPVPAVKTVEVAPPPVSAPTPTTPAMLGGSVARADDNTPVTFNAGLLAFPVDVQMFAEDNPVPEGDYRVDVYLNESWMGKSSVTFKMRKPGDRVALPCFSADMLESLGFDLGKIVPEVLERLKTDAGICGSLNDIVADTQSRFDVGEQRLNLNAPQVALARQPRGWVDPSRWDAGMTAATLAYDYNAWSNRHGETNQTSHFLGLRGGVNLGLWRLRMRGAATRSDTEGLSYRNSDFYVERALSGIASTIILGDTTTRSPVFNSLPLRGVRLETEDSMRPDTLRGFAPVIQGIAQSNAKVSVKQLGMQIFETTVPAGPFVIDDLYPNGSGGDLLVTITEADGSEHSFTVTNNSLPELLRPGTTNYSVSVGRYRNRGLAKEPLLGEASISRGLNNTVTVYGSGLAASGYQAASAGVGLNLPVGAVTFDTTYARTQGAASGVGMRLGYSRRLNATNTDITLAMLRHATSGYYEPDQGLQIVDRIKQGEPFVPRQRTRSQLSLYLNQQLPRAWGSISFAGSVQDYWQRPGRDAQYSIAWGRAIGSVSVTLNAMRSRNVYAERWDNQYMLSFSMPLGKSTQPVYFNTSVTHNRGSLNLQSGVSGALGERNQHTYSVYASADRYRGLPLQTRAGASVGSTTSVARLGANVATGTGGSRQFGVNASGGIVAFKGGVLLSPELGETVGIVHAPHAQGVRVAGYHGAVLNARGQALAAYLQPYRENEVRLDTKGSNMDVELVSTVQKVAPMRGAVVLLQFDTRHGYSVLTTLRRADGSAAPFAAGVFDATGKNVGYMAQGGQALIRVDGLQGELTVRWGAQPDQQCRFAYDMEKILPQEAQTGAFRRVEAVCL